MPQHWASLLSSEAETCTSRSRLRLARPIKPLLFVHINSISTSRAPFFLNYPIAALCFVCNNRKHGNSRTVYPRQKDCTSVPEIKIYTEHYRPISGQSFINGNERVNGLSTFFEFVREDSSEKHDKKLAQTERGKILATIIN